MRARGTRSARSTASAARRARWRLRGVGMPSTATCRCGRACEAGTSPGVPIGGVRLDDVAHESMADDVGFVEVVERDPVDPGQNALNLRQTRHLVLRKVHLRLVACD